MLSTSPSFQDDSYTVLTPLTSQITSRCSHTDKMREEANEMMPEIARRYIFQILVLFFNCCNFRIFLSRFHALFSLGDDSTCYSCTPQEIKAVETPAPLPNRPMLTSLPRSLIRPCDSSRSSEWTHTDRETQPETGTVEENYLTQSKRTTTKLQN